MLSKIRRQMGSGKSSEAGFTLVELLMVIVIVGILAGIGVSGFSSIRARADRAAADAAWNQMQTAIQLLSVDGESVDAGDSVSVLSDYLETSMSVFVDGQGTDLNLWEEDGSGDRTAPLTHANGNLTDSSSGYIIGPGYHCVWSNGVKSDRNPTDCTKVN